MGNPTALGTIEAHTMSPAPITQLALHFDPQTQNGITFWDGAPLDVTASSSPYAVTLSFRADTPAGSYTFQIIATDSTGTSSEPFIVTVIAP
jgi:hypothetical protein